MITIETAACRIAKSIHNKTINDFSMLKPTNARVRTTKTSRNKLLFISKEVTCATLKTLIQKHRNYSCIFMKYFQEICGWGKNLFCQNFMPFVAVSAFHFICWTQNIHFTCFCSVILTHLWSMLLQKSSLLELGTKFYSIWYGKEFHSINWVTTFHFNCCFQVIPFYLLLPSSSFCFLLAWCYNLLSWLLHSFFSCCYCNFFNFLLLLCQLLLV